MNIHRSENDYLHSFPEEQAPSAADIPQPGGIEELIQQIKDTADKLHRDKANRGDVKLLSTALRELRYAFKVFAPFRGRRKVTVFGSARMGPDHLSYKQAVEFGREIARDGFMVVTGAASGIMEAGHVGAGRENSIGVNILLPFEQSANSVIAGDTKLMHLKYFFTRKLLFVKEADAVALFPGGFGTQDEAFEALTLVQTGKSHLFPIVCLDHPGGEYWKDWDRYIRKQMLETKMISPADTSLYKVTESVEEAVADIRNFYRVYHSLRYVRGDLVLRIQRAPSAKLLERIRGEFKDILAGGTFELTHADPVEANESHIQGLPRLRFRFDRRSLGRLRQLVDLLNREIE
jgi:uncharacterized protein (TIGR00730 family)